ncbi:MAG: fructose-6-phosphate aldolase [Proteobacteria bacterium]|nr:fructose-6-phosphate aldolase [Pseudomonadota bacterium]
MKIFLDTANTDEVRKFLDAGLIDGITTNPTLIANSGRNLFEVIRELAEMVNGPISAEVTATDWQGMVAEGRKLAKISKHVVVKVPLTFDGLKACHVLSKENTMVNVTLCFSATQALLAAKAGATFISPFVGRLDDISISGIKLIEEICNIYVQYSSIHTQVLVASVRHPLHVVEAAQLGADVVTIPTKVLEQMLKHPLTDRGLDSFLQDWKATGQSIL